MRIIGIDPGTIKTGFGVIDILGNRIHYVTSGVIRIPTTAMPQRLKVIYQSLQTIIEEHRPDQMSIEEVFFAKNPNSALKLGQARGTAIVCGMNAGLQVSEYAPRLIKKTVVGTGTATKLQVGFMVKKLLSLPAEPQEDAADALAIAICHFHHYSRT